VIALVRGVDDWKVTALKVGLFWLIGVSGIFARRRSRTRPVDDC
jgi:hypothetical protein